MQSDVSSQEKPQKSGDRLHPQAPPGIQEAKTWSRQDGMNVMECQQGQQSTSSAGRSRSQNPSVFALRNWSLSVSERKSQTDSRKLRFDELPDERSNMMYRRTRLHVGIVPNELDR